MTEPHACPITGTATASYTSTPNGPNDLQWTRADPVIHVDAELLRSEARDLLALKYDVREECPFAPGRTRHAYLRERT